jgi:hypothetical protein
MEAAMARDGIKTNDRQLACARINSKEGQVRGCVWVRQEGFRMGIRKAGRVGSGDIGMCTHQQQ